MVGLRGATSLKKRNSFSPKSHQLAIATPISGADQWTLPLYAGMTLPCGGRHSCCEFSSPAGMTFSSPSFLASGPYCLFPSSVMFLQPWGGGDGDVLFVAEHPHFLSALWPSTIRHIRKAGWWGLRVALVCEYRDMNLEGSLSLYPLSRIRAVVYSRVLWTPQPWVLGQIHRTRHAFPLVKQVLSPTRAWLVTLYHRVTVTLMGMSCHSSHYCSS